MFQDVADQVRVNDKLSSGFDVPVSLNELLCGSEDDQEKVAGLGFRDGLSEY
jgi:hypothetical protein